MNRRLSALAATLALTAGALAAEPPNLLRNGGFEEGDLTPVGWQTVDGLTSFRVGDPDPARGKVLKFDTDVLQSQGYAWWEHILAGASPADAPAKLPTHEPKYDTLAGLDGVWFYSDPVPVEPGKSYWLSMDARGPQMRVWLLGYAEEPDLSFGADAAAFQGYLKDKAGTRDPVRGFRQELHRYDWKGQLRVGGSDEWRTYSRREKPFQPTLHTPSVRYVRVMLLPYWPPAEYRVDNVRLVEWSEPPAP